MKEIFLYVDKDGTHILSNEDLVRDEKGFWKKKGQRKKENRMVTILSEEEKKQFFDINRNWLDNKISLTEAIKKEQNIRNLKIEIQKTMDKIKELIKSQLNIRKTNSVLLISEKYQTKILEETIYRQDFKNLLSKYFKLKNYKICKITYNLNNPLSDLLNMVNNWDEEQKINFMLKIQK